MLNYRLCLESVRLCGSISALSEPAGPTGQSTPSVPDCQVYPRLLSRGELWACVKDGGSVSSALQ